MGRLLILALFVVTGCGRMAGEMVGRAVGEGAINAVIRAAQQPSPGLHDGMAPAIDPTPQLVETGRAAAYRGECDQVMNTAATLHQTNRWAHDAFVADPAVAWCIGQVRSRSAIA